MYGYGVDDLTENLTAPQWQEPLSSMMISSPWRAAMIPARVDQSKRARPSRLVRSLSIVPEGVAMGRPSQAVKFPGAAGHALAARLDLPSVAGASSPRAYALFAHCFTCSKDSKAATFISEALTEAGIAVLRFDFTGLGGSEGEFANTTFSSNVADLVAAAAWLRSERAAPAILVGHSLGGAAVLAAAGQIPEAVAVATINAPADPAHVEKLFAGQRAEIDVHGEAEVELSGRKYRIRREFLQDVAAQKLSEAV